ncbi:AMP-binding protein, partial [Myxococcota bacterium]|nr:AMP-binding protein [Myxococcota bacterium]
MFSVKSSEIHGVNQYVTLHRESLAHRDDFWRAQGEALVWRTPFSEIFSEDMEKGRFTWFGGGILNPLDSLLGVDPAAKALEVYEGEEQVGEWTFGELFHRAMEFHLFFAANGVKPQDRVALYLPNSLDYVAALFALTAFSATAVPLLVRYPGSFIARVAADCGARLLVLDDSSDDSEYKQRCDVISQLVEQGIVYT